MKTEQPDSRNIWRVVWGLVESYGVLALAIVAETWAVDFLEGHIPGVLGIIVTWLAFVVGGVAFGLLAARNTKRGEVLRDPFYGGCAWLCRHWKTWGFMLSTGVIGGAMSVSPHFKSVGHPHLLRMMTIGATLYATIWLVILPLLIPVMRFLPLVGRFF